MTRRRQRRILDVKPADAPVLLADELGRRDGRSIESDEPVRLEELEPGWRRLGRHRGVSGGKALLDRALENLDVAVQSHDDIGERTAIAP